MEMHGDVTRQDLDDFNWYVYRHSSILKGQGMAVVLVGALFSALLLGAVVLGKSSVTLAKAPYIGSGLIVALLFLLLRRVVFVRRLKTILAQAESTGMTGPQKLILSPQGITNIDNVGQHLYEWKTVGQSMATENCAYIFVGKANAFIVAKRFFPSDSAYTDFLNAVREYKAQVSPT